MPDCKNKNGKNNSPVSHPHGYMQETTSVYDNKQQTMWVHASSFCPRMPQAGQAIVKPRAHTSFMRNSNAHDIKWVCKMSSLDSFTALARASDIRRGGPFESTHRSSELATAWDRNTRVSNSMGYKHRPRDAKIAIMCITLTIELELPATHAA